MFNFALIETNYFGVLMKKGKFVKSVILILSTLIISCKSNSTTVNSHVPTNSKDTLKKTYLILISLDGFRWDYVERFNPPNIKDFIKNGVKAESLIPLFPSKTFPNHYSIATGMYPDNHGIIGNSFYSYKKDKLYRLGDREAVEDGTFYKGTPIWVAAEKEGMLSASFFFVGTEADIQGIHPTYYYKFDNSIKNEIRIRQALDWLGLPPKERPHLITMYFSDMDDTGHKYGPNSDEQLKETLFTLDKHLGDLFKGVKKTGLPVNIIIVSDHGMAPISVINYIPIKILENKTLFNTLNNGAIVNIHPKEQISVDSIYNYLKKKEHNFKVYKTKDTPSYEYIPKNKDWGEIQVIPDYGYYFISSKGLAAKKQGKNKTFGVHGYDPKHKDMHGIFYANGPAFRNDYKINSIENIHIYPLMTEVLELKNPANIDGSLEKLKDVLRYRE